MKFSMRIVCLALSLIMVGLSQGFLGSSEARENFMPDPAGDVQKAYDDWVAANEAVKEAKKKAQDAKDKLANTMAVSATGGITEGEERALAKARDEVAQAEAALKDAEARLEAARIELEKAIAELEDEKLKKELIRKRDGYIAAQRFTAIAPAKASVETKSGLRTITFETTPGKIKVHLPDDMRAGDTISGTVVVEPNGQTKEERARNRSALSQYEIMIANSRPSANDFILKLFKKKTTKPNTGTGSNIDFSEPCVCPFGFGLTGSGQFVTVEQAASTPTGGAAVPATCVEGCPVFLAYGSVLDNISGDPTTMEAQYLKPLTEAQIDQIYDMKDTAQPPLEPKPNEFRLPSVGQQGRSIEIFGPFDGNAFNTTLRFGPQTSTVKDFEKGTESVSGGFGVIRPLAESPRKLVFESPNNVTGPVTILVKEGNGAPTTVPYRNVAVDLSADKLHLQRGERTTLRVDVRGLEGIKKDVPLQLDSKGVITMDGGNFQNLSIKPSEVTPNGRYTATRAITGQQAGGFSVTATVIVRRFDFCLQDDSDPNRIFHFNSFTGDYLFACGGGSCRPGGSTGGTQTGGTPGKPGGTTQPGGTIQPGGTTPPGGTGTPPIVPTGTTLTGTGRPQMKGCIIVLTHNAPDRRVFARLDACTKSGDASVETTSPKAKINITDKNTTDNTVGSPPPK